MVYVATIIAVVMSASLLSPSTSQMKSTNVIFIMYDDLRPDLTVYERDYMITPNFERLAAKCVVFDHAYAQISVCNPSRDSLLTGLRPDTVGTYSFQTSFRPHLIMPTRFAKAGYNTAGYGKIVHWESDDKEIWNFDHWDGDWYGYQGREPDHMNSTTMPDKVMKEEEFRDHLFTSKFINTLRTLAKLPKKFMLAIGFKLPHLSLHVPYKYYKMYNNQTKKEAWKLSRKELTFPPTSPVVSYRCCAERTFRFMREEGSQRQTDAIPMGDVNSPIPGKIRNELMMGYAAGITFLDVQLGRILDVMDELQLWDTTTLVLTADHGMHNGEKGIWEKWSLFDESTRVPLFIHHPLSPFKGQHYTHPVELIDIFPTVNDLVAAPQFDRKKYCRDGKPLCTPSLFRTTYCVSMRVERPHVLCPELQGKSLAKVVLGDGFNYGWPGMNSVDSSKASSAKSIYRITPYSRNSNSNSSSSSTSSQSSSMSSSMYGNNRDGSFNRSNKKSTRKFRANSTQTPEPLPTAIRSTTINTIKSPNDVIYRHQFALSQNWRCSPKKIAMDNKNPQNPSLFISGSSSTMSNSSLQADAMTKNAVVILEEAAKFDAIETHARIRASQWSECDRKKIDPNELSVMGYSIRTKDFRYTAWLYFDKKTMKPDLVSHPFEEELYDHRQETPRDFTHREVKNLVYQMAMAEVVKCHREKLISFIKEDIVFRGPIKD